MQVLKYDLLISRFIRCGNIKYEGITLIFLSLLSLAALSKWVISFGDIFMSYSEERAFFSNCMLGPFDLQCHLAPMFLCVFYMQVIYLLVRVEC